MLRKIFKSSPRIIDVGSMGSTTRDRFKGKETLSYSKKVDFCLKGVFGITVILFIFFILKASLNSFSSLSENTKSGPFLRNTPLEEKIIEKTTKTKEKGRRVNHDFLKTHL